MYQKLKSISLSFLLINILKVASSDVKHSWHYSSSNQLYRGPTYKRIIQEKLELISNLILFKEMLESEGVLSEIQNLENNSNKLSDSSLDKKITKIFSLMKQGYAYQPTSFIYKAQDIHNTKNIISQLRLEYLELLKDLVSRKDSFKIIDSNIFPFFIDQNSIINIDNEHYSAQMFKKLEDLFNNDIGGIEKIRNPFKKEKILSLIESNLYNWELYDVLSCQSSELKLIYELKCDPKKLKMKPSNRVFLLLWSKPFSTDPVEKILVNTYNHRTITKKEALLMSQFGIDPKLSGFFNNYIVDNPLCYEKFYYNYLITNQTKLFRLLTLENSILLIFAQEDSNQEITFFIKHYSYNFLVPNRSHCFQNFDSFFDPNEEFLAANMETDPFKLKTKKVLNFKLKSIRKMNQLDNLYFDLNMSDNQTFFLTIGSKSINEMRTLLIFQVDSNGINVMEKSNIKGLRRADYSEFHNLLLFSQDNDKFGFSKRIYNPKKTLNFNLLKDDNIFYNSKCLKHDYENLILVISLPKKLISENYDPIWRLQNLQTNLGSLRFISTSSSKVTRWEINISNFLFVNGSTSVSINSMVYPLIDRTDSNIIFSISSKPLKSIYNMGFRFKYDRSEKIQINIIDENSTFPKGYGEPYNDIIGSHIFPINPFMIKDGKFETFSIINPNYNSPNLFYRLSQGSIKKKFIFLSKNAVLFTIEKKLSISYNSSFPLAKLKGSMFHNKPYFIKRIINFLFDGIRDEFYFICHKSFSSSIIKIIKIIICYIIKLIVNSVKLFEKSVNEYNLLKNNFFLLDNPQDLLNPPNSALIYCNYLQTFFEAFNYPMFQIPDDPEQVLNYKFFVKASNLLLLSINSADYEWKLPTH